MVFGIIKNGLYFLKIFGPVLVSIVFGLSLDVCGHDYITAIDYE